MEAYKLTLAVTLLSSVMMFWFAMYVGKMRTKHGVQAPAMTGHDEFERAARVQMNTIEQAVMFLPVMWVLTVTTTDICGASAGALWIVGRVLYATTYWKDATKRGPGMMIGAVAWLLALLGAVYAVATL